MDNGCSIAIYLFVVNYSDFCYNQYMNETLILIHVASMILSLVLMFTSVGLGLYGKTVAVRTASAGFYLSVAGFLSGGILLLGSTLTFQCALLTGFLLASTVLYHIGFGFGNLAKARLVRQPVSVQDRSTKV